MPNITLSISEELHKVVKQHNEIKWSEIARRAISEQVQKIKMMEKIASKSKLTEKGIDEIDHKIKSALVRRFTK